MLRGSATAAGKVLLTYGAKKVTLTLKGGRASFRLPKVRKGTLKVTASYLGDTTTAKSTATRSIKVTRELVDELDAVLLVPLLAGVDEGVLADEPE